MPALARSIIPVLVGSLAVLASLTGLATWRARHPGRVQLSTGRLADAPLRMLPPANSSLFGTLWTPYSLASTARGGQCSVIVFFSSSCPALREFARSWGRLSQITVGAMSAPVVWVAIFPADSLADDSAHTIAGVERIYWLTRADDAPVRGVDVIPSAWIVNDSLRILGVTTDTSQARLAIAECAGSRVVGRKE